MPLRLPTVLIVEDNDLDRTAIRNMLHAGPEPEFAPLEAETLSTARLTLGLKEGIEVVLLDLDLPDSGGVQTLREVAAIAPTTPIVVLSGNDDRRLALSAVQEGAQDYLVKRKLDRSLLLKTLRYAIERRRAVLATQASQERERFERVFRGSPDAIALTHAPVGGIFEVNDRFLELSGLSREQVVGYSPVVRALFSPTDRRRMVTDLARNHELHRFETRIQNRSSGVVRFVQISTVQVDLVEGSSRVWFFRDVTAEREATRSIRRLSQNLLRLQDEERRRVARELHDGISPNLVALSMELSALKRVLGLASTHKRQLARSLELLKRSLRELRTASYLLHPPLLDERGLPAALRWLADGFAERSGIRVDVQIPEGFSRLPGAHETALFRVAQESLSNVHRHSGSEAAWVAIEQENGSVRLEIGDNGRGFDPGSVVGVGIAGMEERIRHLGGNFEIIGSGGGTRIRVELPVKPAAGEDA